MRTIYRELDRVGQIMLESLTGPLEVPKDFFFKLSDEGNSILRLLHYPPIPEGVDPRSILRGRARRHQLNYHLGKRDNFGPTAFRSRLELGSISNQDPNSLIVDAGDMLARLTNNVIPSTTSPSGESRRTKLAALLDAVLHAPESRRSFEVPSLLRW